jgi:hypothetical protein
LKEDEHEEERKSTRGDVDVEQPSPGSLFRQSTALTECQLNYRRNGRVFTSIGPTPAAQVHIIVLKPWYAPRSARGTKSATMMLDRPDMPPPPMPCTAINIRLERGTSKFRERRTRTPCDDQPFHRLSAPGQRATNGKQNDGSQHDGTPAKDVRQIPSKRY